jgi:pimeloyl-ACP methyl ester carboxylesterase
MPNVFANGIQIEYETFGEPSSPALLLIAGIGGQMMGWDEALCKKWAQKGLYVIHFDNRDVGLTTKMEEAVLPDIEKVVKAVKNGKKASVPYTVGDMADDSIGLLEALKIDKAHICGISMGGIIAQTIAFKHPARVRSLTLIYSTTGNPDLPQPKPEVMELLLTPQPPQRDGFIDYQMKLYKRIHGLGFPIDEAWHRQLAALSYDRAYYPLGKARQFAAITAQGNRKPLLASITAPTLVIHGADDPLIPVAAGVDIAEAIPGAELMIIEGMGHDMPHDGAWFGIVEAVTAHIRKADGL